MAFKRCTRIVYNTLAEDFDDLEEFLDGVSVDLFVVWRRFTKTSRLFQSTDGDYSSTRVFPGVPFDSESSKENQSKALMVISPVPGCFLVYRLNNEVKQTTRLFQSTDGDFSSTRVFPGVPFDKC